VRAYNGTESRWYKAALWQKTGRITAAGMTKDVAFEPVSGPINDRVDDVYRSKYARKSLPEGDDRRTCASGNGQDNATRHADFYELTIANRRLRLKLCLTR
jgi:hypothetical protein